MEYGEKNDQLIIELIILIDGTIFIFCFNFSLALQWIDAGLIVHLLNKNYPTTPQCQADNNISQGKATPIKLNDLIGVHIILLFGLSLSFLAFIFEKIVFGIVKPRKSKF